MMGEGLPAFPHFEMVVYYTTIYYTTIEFNAEGRGSGGTGPDPSARENVPGGLGRGGTGPLPSARSVKPWCSGTAGAIDGCNRTAADTLRMKPNSFRDFIFCLLRCEIWAARPRWGQWKHGTRSELNYFVGSCLL